MLRAKKINKRFQFLWRRRGLAPLGVISPWFQECDTSLSWITASATTATKFGRGGRGDKNNYKNSGHTVRKFNWWRCCIALNPFRTAKKIFSDFCQKFTSSVPIYMEFKSGEIFAKSFFVSKIWHFIEFLICLTVYKHIIFNLCHFCTT